MITEPKTGVRSRRVSLRWQFNYQGRTFIVYGNDQKDVYQRVARFVAPAFLVPEPVSSGYYDYATNTIVDPGDGPATFVDTRKAPGA